MQTSYKVVFVNPPLKFRADVAYMSLPPLGVLYLSACLKRNGISAAMIDLNQKPCTAESAAGLVLALQPEVVGITVPTDNLETSLAIAAAVKSRSPATTIVLGGPHINSTGAETMAEPALGRNIDYSFVRESEHSFLEFMSRVPLERVPGLVYRDAGGILRSNRPEPLNVPLDTLPFPDLRDVVNVSAYRSPFFRGGKTVTMMSSRGCPYNCKFCDVHQNMGKKYRLRSPENIVEEIIFHRQTIGVRNVIFKDSIFNLDLDHTVAFCELLIRKNLRIHWMCNSRTSNIDEALVKLMAASGCRTISFGVESLDPVFLQKMGKQNSVENIKHCFAICRSKGINTLAYMMVGCEGETYASNRASFDELLRLNPTFAEFAVSTLYPGTELYRESLEKGFLKNPRWYLAFGPGRREGGYLSLPDFPVPEQVRASKESYRRFYFRPGKILEILLKFMSIALLRTMMTFLLLQRKRHEF
jgi:radical SAM superfamily enzyme YgiQ (UPF0313 family)